MFAMSFSVAVLNACISAMKIEVVAGSPPLTIWEGSTVAERTRFPIFEPSVYYIYGHCCVHPHALKEQSAFSPVRWGEEFLHYKYTHLSD